MYGVPLLTVDNFAVWKYKMEFILKDKGLWSCVQPPPSSLSSSTSDSSPPSSSSASPIADSEKEQKALAQIALTVSEEMIAIVKSAKSAREAWSLICDQFEQKGISSQVSLKRQLFNSKFKEGSESTGMKSHINNIRSLALQLETIGASMPDQDLAVILLCSLPARFDAFVVQMDSRPAKEITFNFVCNRLLSEAERQSTKNQEGGYDTPIALAARRSGPRSRRPGEDSDSRPHCPWCNRDGHTEARCYDKRDGKPSVNGQQPVAAAVYHAPQQIDLFAF